MGGFWFSGTKSPPYHTQYRFPNNAQCLFSVLFCSYFAAISAAGVEFQCCEDVGVNSKIAVSLAKWLRSGKLYCFSYTVLVFRKKVVVCYFSLSFLQGHYNLL